MGGLEWLDERVRVLKQETDSGLVLSWMGSGTGDNDVGAGKASGLKRANLGYGWGRDARWRTAMRQSRENKKKEKGKKKGWTRTKMGGGACHLDE